MKVSLSYALAYVKPLKLITSTEYVLLNMIDLQSEDLDEPILMTLPALAKHSLVTTRGMSRHIKRLKDRGVLNWKRGACNRPNSYTLISFIEYHKENLHIHELQKEMT